MSDRNNKERSWEYNTKMVKIQELETQVFVIFIDMLIFLIVYKYLKKIYAV